MSIPVWPPGTYGEWLTCFNYLRENRADNTYIDCLKKGSLKSDPQLLLRFENQLVNLINTLLERKTKRFIKEFNNLIEFNELSGLVLLFRRFKKDVSSCLFFDELQFLPSDMKSELSKSIRAQIEEFLQDVLGHLKNQALEHNNLELEDVLYQIKRIKIFS